MSARLIDNEIDKVKERSNSYVRGHGDDSKFDLDHRHGIAKESDIKIKVWHS